MKLYTEADLKKVISIYSEEYKTSTDEILKELNLTPIELPSDEEIDKQAEHEDTYSKKALLQEAQNGCGTEHLDATMSNYKQSSNQVPDVRKMVSSVEWFSKESWKLKVKLENKEITIGEYGVTYVDLLNQAKAMHKDETTITENTSDGYHTFKELYEIRKAYNVALFNGWYMFDIPSYNVHKSWKHHDGEFCFGGGWFIVVAILPTGQISNHYKAEDWDLFKIPEVEKALFPFDGHTTEDVISRLINF